MLPYISTLSDTAMIANMHEQLCLIANDAMTCAQLAHLNDMAVSALRVWQALGEPVA